VKFRYRAFRYRASREAFIGHAKAPRERIPMNTMNHQDTRTPREPRPMEADESLFSVYE
jgi:hypothetical protein